ncbi:unnamed protein product [Allacma fusca]|uniref:BTB domain-containing protein n=1 Tax=Allacma fusca TaxID=39272 RepID=A0A8J2NZR8_9HEXA|nr:unnamed protein product [Allacma fusca]
MAHQVVWGTNPIRSSRIMNWFVRENIERRVLQDPRVTPPPKLPAPWNSLSSMTEAGLRAEVRRNIMNLVPSAFVIQKYREEYFYYYLLLTDTDSHHALNIRIFDTRVELPISPDYESSQLFQDLDDLRSFNPSSGWRRFCILARVLSLRHLDLPPLFCFSCGGKDHQVYDCTKEPKLTLQPLDCLETRVDFLQFLVTHSELLVDKLKLERESQMEPESPLMDAITPSQYAKSFCLSPPAGRFTSFEYLMGPTPSDVTIITSDGHSRKFHKLVLAAQSEVLAQDLTTMMDSGSKPPFTLKWGSIDSAILDLLWTFFYKGIVRVPSKHLDSLQDLFQKLKVSYNSITPQQEPMKEPDVEGARSAIETL